MAKDAASAKRQKTEVKDPLALRTGGSKVLIIDGGLSTHMEALGEDINCSLWSAKCLVNNPEVIQRAHADYYNAGADVAITSSYQANFVGFKQIGVSEAGTLDAVRLSVSLARKAAPPGALVAGSVGPYGAALANGAEYTGDYPGMDEQKLADWHRPRMTALVEAGCDVLACETVPCLTEARALVKIIDELRHPAWVTFSCKSGTEVCSGDKFADCMDVVAKSEYVVGSGLNCTAPEFVSSLVKICREKLPDTKHVVAYPNSGEVYDGDSKTWVSGTATADEKFVSLAKGWNKLGADCIGGCCRTSPKTIAAMRKAFTGDN